MTRYARHNTRTCQRWTHDEVSDDHHQSSYLASFEMDFIFCWNLIDGIKHFTGMELN